MELIHGTRACGIRMDERAEAPARQPSITMIRAGRIWRIGDMIN